MKKNLKAISYWEKPIYLGKKCQCYKKKIQKQKKNLESTRTKLSEGKLLKYPVKKKLNESRFIKTFFIKYEGKLSLQAKTMLNSFKNKYVYYAIEDILDFYNLEFNEKEQLKTFLYSSMISLQNDFSINFFDIWIKSIYYNDIKIDNKFIKSNSRDLNQITQITLKLSYLVKSPIQKVNSLW